MDIIGKRYWFFALSLLVIIPGMIALAVWGLPLSIDFTGGSMLEVKFEAGKTPTTEQVIAVYHKLNLGDPEIQTSENDTLIIRSKEINEDVKNSVVAEMKSQFGSVTVNSFDTVGPSVGLEVTQRAALAVGLASLGILAYISFAFRSTPNAFRYGVAAIIAMLHDVAVVIGMAALFGHFLHWEVDSLFLTALLTVIGFSVHDTVVVYDRIRENSSIYRTVPYTQIVNHSVVQTLDRSINTQLTVMFTLMALVLFGGVTIRHFIVILLIGVFSGAYSSTFNAAPILVIWENKEWRTWFRKSKASTGNV